MVSFIEQILSILTSSPGNLVYFLVVAFTITAAFQLSINQWRRSGFPQGKRMVIGLGILLLVQIIQFTLAILAWQNLFPLSTVLPPLERAIGLLILVVAAWLWLFPEPDVIADVATFFIGLLVLVFFFITYAWWGTQPFESTYNGSWADFASVIFALVLLGLSSLLMLIRRPNGWGFGLAMNMIFLGGYVAWFWLPQYGSDYVGVIRLSQMMAIPMLLYLPQRFNVPAEIVQTALPSTAKEVRRYRVDPALVNDFLNLAANASPEQAGQTITRLVSELMVSDICLLAAPPDASGTLAVSCGYDLIKQAPIEGFNLDSHMTPILSSAMRRGRHVRLPSSSTSQDLASLAQALKLGRSGHLLAAPVVAQGLQPLMGIILLLPYSNRGWTIDDQNHLIRLSESLALILSQKEELNRLREEAEHGPASRTEPVPGVKEIVGESDIHLNELEILRDQLAQERFRSESLALMIASSESLQQKTRQIDAEMTNLQGLLRVAPGKDGEEAENLSIELRMSLEEIARLNNALLEADQKLLNLSSEEAKLSFPNVQTEVVATIIQDLRQPLSSIVVYTDLLLGESVGILGATQRKFVERIKASVERMEGLADDLVQMVMDNQGRAITPEKVDLNDVIDVAVAQAMVKLRKRNIILRLDVPDQLPPLQADRDALQQILVHLLQNAGDTSPQEGEIALSAQVEVKENEPAFVLIQVTDSGGGIPAEELPRVFSRMYRADNSLIQGVGETGVGLSVVKSLVEAHGGRIWVDSVMGRGATFSVLLPASVEQLVPQDSRDGAV
jgi:signal transduction histidine kinase